MTITVAPARQCAVEGVCAAQRSSQISQPTTRPSTQSQEKRISLPKGISLPSKGRKETCSGAGVKCLVS